MNTSDLAAPTQFKPVSKPTPTLSDLSSAMPSPEELQSLLPKDSYLIEGFLGQGGMGAVYRGIQISLDRPVAIKVLPLTVGVEYDFADRFRREAQSMAALNHPGIVSVYDFGTVGGRFLYFVMELVDGSDLHQVLKSKQMTPDLALWLMPQICDAVATAHELGIYHRDIKPANILLTRQWRVKVADFGLAKRAVPNEHSLMTQAGLGLGTPDYAAPEQFELNASVDHRADIYALGVTLYQMLTGRLPRGAWQPPSAMIGTDARLDAVIVKAMSPQPEQRYQTTREFAHAIVHFQQTLAWEAQQQVVVKNPSSNTTLPKSPASKSKSVRILGVAAALVLLGFGAWLGMKPGKQPQSQSQPTTVALNPPKERTATASPQPPPSATVLEHKNQPTPQAPKTTAATEKPIAKTQLPSTLAPTVPPKSPEPQPPQVNPISMAEPTGELVKPMPQLAKLPDPSKWKPVFPAAYLKNGSIEIPERQSVFSPPDVKFGDGAVRFTVAKSELANGLLVRIRAASPNLPQAGYQLQCNVEAGELRTVSSVDKSKVHTSPRYGDFAGDTLEITLASVGKTTAVFANGTPIGSFEDDTFSEGGFYFYALKTSKLTNVVWQSLDPAPEAAPKDAIDLQLEKLAAEYQAEFDKLGGSAFKAALATLNTQFTAALDRAAVQTQQRGQLDDVLILQAEAKRMKEAPSAPELDDDSTPAVLKPLYATYRKSLAKLTADRDARTKPAVEDYQKKLTAYQTQLTKAGDISGAVKVKEVIQQSQSVELVASLTVKSSNKSAVQTSKPGRLRGWGVAENSPINLTNSDPFNDFIQVIGKEHRWVALRSNGEVSSSLGGLYDFKLPVSRLIMVDGANFVALHGKKGFTIRWNGSFGAELVEASSYGGGEVRDVAVVNSGVFAVLRTDGTVRLRDTSRRKSGSPGIKPNEAVKLTRDLSPSIALVGASDCLFVLSVDGKISGWYSPYSNVKNEGASLCWVGKS
ncbi:MAG: protein kinase [Prosthecobacter sp.]|jgi:serine/threonine protein kinase|uniref:serine/threonine protein kinase n=1 Tax=Prosthecobacter sp. TaxID=1965333 RepID=UPI0019E2D3BE|nr:serine/threonine-protein kinase [Prosthecobacter sp.]MBE2287446.1 protein kinase [Prosthecobacter sp.]